MCQDRLCYRWGGRSCITYWNMRFMKFIIAIVQDYDCDKLLRAVTAVGLRATRVASTGGFLRAGNTTVLMGVDNHRVSECLQLIQRSCRSRVEVKIDPESPDLADWVAAGVHEVTVGGAVVFITSVKRFERILPPDA